MRKEDFYITLFILLNIVNWILCIVMYEHWYLRRSF